MAEASTIARPYAQAIFELAKENGSLAKWSESLGVLSEAVKNNDIANLISNPNIVSEQVGDLLIAVGADKLDQEGKNFVKVLADNGRLNVLNEISAIFEDLKASAEKTVQAEVITAFKLTEEHKKRLSAALKKQLGCEVELSSSIDKSIIGGAIIRAGDTIIDGSVTTQLQRLSSELSH